MCAYMAMGGTNKQIHTVTCVHVRNRVYIRMYVRMYMCLREEDIMYLKAHQHQNWTVHVTTYITDTYVHLRMYVCMITTYVHYFSQSLHKYICTYVRTWNQCTVTMLRVNSLGPSGLFRQQACKSHRYPAT